jgi:competence protein ComEC
VQVLAPGPDSIAAATPNNDDSLVMRIRFGNTSFLLTGDMEKKIERDVAAAGLFEHDDVLKVGHHGSRTSSTPALLDAERPAFGIISDGFDNTYGHPHPLTLKALRERNVAVFRTDEEGLITIVSDGKRLRFNTAAPFPEGNSEGPAEH